MQAIQLTQGKIAIVDDADFNQLSQYRWFAYRKPRKSRTLGYAARQLPRANGKQKMLYMHRALLPNAPEVDHVNSDGLDNRRQNLRSATRRQNTQNMLKATNHSSELKGVTWHSKAQKWQAQIRVDGRNRYLGLFVNETLAGAAYRQAAQLHFGEFARA